MVRWCMRRIKYRGKTGELLRIEYVDGKIDHFEGEKDKEQLVRVENAVGRIEHYKAKKGELRLVRVENNVVEGDAQSMRAEALRAEAAVKARELHRTGGAEAESDLQRLLRERIERLARDETTRMEVHAEITARMDTGVRPNPLLVLANRCALDYSAAHST